MSDALEKIVVEAREEFRPKAVDWYAVDHGLFARVDADRRAARARATRERGQLWTAAAAALAAAGIVLVLVARPGHQRPTAQSDGDGTAATLLGIEGAGEVLVNGAHASLGAGLRRGDVVEARGATATFARPGHVTVVIEADARAVVARVEDPLVLTLDRGAVDAQVVPVPSGEAFAVDVDGARVAVHGTHLRVARSDGKVTVDLSEGVVSVGRAPRVGSVLGTLVTAPAHAEFTAADIRGTMTVTHDPSAVREPQTAFGPAAALPQVTPATNPAVPARLPVASASEAHPTVNAAPKPLPATPSAESVVEPPAAPSSAGPAPLPSSPTAVDPDAENTVAGAVRACISEHPRPDGMTVVVSTTLHLWLGGDGSVRSARFEPPVAPDVNTCAAAAIYRTRFPKSGSVKIPVDFSN